MYEDQTLSISISKLNPEEEMTIAGAYWKDASDRAGTDPAQGSITTERIRKDDVLLGLYKVVSDEIRGGMGSVWRVHHEGWDTDLAIKQPLPRFFAEAGPAKRARFIDECATWIGLGMHPHIVSCYYVRECSGIPTIFSEWMEGGSLKDRIEDGTLYEGTGGQMQERILSIAIQAARGLDYAHGKGLVHQDMKPGNLLLSAEWEAKAADFGLAMARSRLTEGSSVTAAGYTAAYCPAEQARGAEPAPWMDVYAWALTVLEMYAGGRIWETGADAFATVFEKADRGECGWRVEPPEELMELIRRYFGGSKYNPDEAAPGARDFTEIKEVLPRIYRDVTGTEFPAESGSAVEVTTDALNNLALSYMDLGMKDVAEKYWQEALRINPLDFETCINEGLYQWRNARITALDMYSRISYFGGIYRNYPPDDERRKNYGKVLDEFYAESEEGMEDFIRGFDPNFLSNIETYDPGKETADGRPVGDGGKNPGDGQPIGAGAKNPSDGPVYDAEPAAPEAGSREYLFRLQEITESGEESRMDLQILEQPSGRVMRSFEVRPWNYWWDEREKIRYCHYPRLIADYKNHKLILASEEMKERIVYDMPVPPPVRRLMPYQQPRPISFRERSAQDRERENCREAFREAAGEQSFDRMLSAYDRIWELPMTGENSLQARMNSELMQLCRMPGVHKRRQGPGPAVVVESIWEHDPADPAPSGMYGILPLQTDVSGDPFSNRPDWPFGTAVYDTADVKFYYTPWNEKGGEQPGCVEVHIWDKQKKEMFERVIPFQTEGRYVYRVIAVSAGGDFLILELREGSGEYSAEDHGKPFSIVCATRNGYVIGEILQDRGGPSYEAVMIEDGQAAPHRGYLWVPLTNRIVYFELVGNEIEVYDRLPVSGGGYAGIPMPEELIPEERSYYWGDSQNRERLMVIESLALAAAGHSMVLITRVVDLRLPPERRMENAQRKICLYKTEQHRWQDGNWKIYDVGSRERFLMSPNLHYYVSGIHGGLNRTGWRWDLYPLEMSRKQRPVWTLQEFTDESRIASLSGDFCSLLDERGRAAYAICWQYEKGR